MMSSGLLSFLITSYLSSTSDKVIFSSWWSLLIGFIFGILAALLVGLIAGVLKAFLNVNEVVTTILLNWIIYYICYQILKGVIQYPFALSQGFSSSPTTKDLVFQTDFFKSQIFAWLILIISIIFAFSMWILLKRTTLGYKIKMNGLNKEAAKYAGVNEKVLTILVIVASSIFAGIAGFLWFVFVRGKIAVGSSPETIGFDAIAVSLLGHNSPIGSIFTSIFYAFLTTSPSGGGLQLLSSKLDEGTVQIISGIIIYLAAISVVFAKFRPINKFIKFIFLIKSKYFYTDLKGFNFSLINKKIHTENQNNLLEFKKQTIDYLQKENMNFVNHIEKLNKLAKEHKISIFKTYWTIKYLLFKKYLKSKQIIKIKNLKNSKNWAKWKNELKNTFYARASENLSDDQKLNFYNELSKKRIILNEKLTNSGYFDFKILKEQYELEKIENKKWYNYEKSLIVESMLKKHSNIRMEIK